MFSGFLTIFQFLWPFLKEALFGDGTFKSWVRANYMTVLWFLMMLVMLALVLALTNMLKSAESDLAAQLSATTKYREQVADLTKANAQLTLENAQLKMHPAKAPACKDPAPSHVVHPPPSPRDDHHGENDTILRGLKHIHPR